MRLHESILKQISQVYLLLFYISCKKDAHWRTYVQWVTVIPGLFSFYEVISPEKYS